nr:CHASE domain-containing protein [Motiliproteus sp. SC1-56]
MRIDKTPPTSRQPETEPFDLHREVFSRRWLSQVWRPAPWVVLAVSLAITTFASFVTESEVTEKQRLRFEKQVDHLVQLINSRLKAYRSLLQAGVGFLNASESADRAEWGRFHRSLHIEALYPGIQGYGYAEFVSPESKEAYEASIRAEGFDDFRIYPPGEREIYTAIRYLEPFDWRNQRAFGYDMYSDAVRREAMARARDEGRAMISGPVTLVQETQVDTQTGFLMYLPHYRTGAFLDTVAQRREAILGYVYSPFRMEDLMRGMLAGERNFVAFQVFDSGSGSAEPQTLNPSAAETAMYRSSSDSPVTSREPWFKGQRALEIGGRTWTLEVQSTEAFEAASENYMSLVVFAAGLIDGLLLFMMTLAFLAAREDNRQVTRHLARKTEAERRYRVLLDAIPTGLLAVRADGRVQQANRQACQLLGYSEGELAQMGVEELLPEEYRHQHVAFRQGFLADPRQRLMGRGGDLYALSRGGEKIPVEIGLSPLQTARGMLVLVTIVDIRERRQTQQELHQLMQRLRQKNSEMEQFVYTVSHDLKAPLVTIEGFADKLAEKLNDVLTDQQKHWFGRIQANVKSMNGLLGDLLELSRIIHRDAEVRPLDTGQLVKAAMANLAGAIHKSGARVVVAKEMPTVVGQERLLVQCFQNLIANAIKYQRPGVKPRIEVSASRQEAEVRVAVADNGLGIDPRHHERIFQIFERLDPEGAEGSGVGLAIVKTIMDKHGGRVCLDSVPGEGSTFTLCFAEPPLGGELEP